MDSQICVKCERYTKVLIYLQDVGIQECADCPYLDQETEKWTKESEQDKDKIYILTR